VGTGHDRSGHHRKLLFFLTFHTAAYQAFTNLDFAKNKVAPYTQWTLQIMYA